MSSPEEVYIRNQLDLEAMGHISEDVEQYSTRERRWRNAKVAMAIAPLVAGVTINATILEKFNWEDKFDTDAGGVISGVVLWSVGDTLEGRNRKRAWEMSKRAVPIAERLRAPLPKNIRQALESELR